MKMISKKTKKQPKKPNQESQDEFEKIVSDFKLFQTPTLEQPAPAPLRVVGLFGDVNEMTSAEIVQSLLVLSKQGEITDNGKKKSKYLHPPIEFYINTHGGSASDMFAIYDMMRSAQTRCEVQTIGLGKIMSAGVLLLAAGTKGKRRVGKNARVMIHSVLGTNEGPLFNLENEINEIRFVQEKYTQALIRETKLTPITMKKLLERRVNIYLSADEAVKYGIADEVF